MAASVYEHEARERKARAIAAVLRQADCDADTAGGLSGDARRLAVALAGYKDASDTTWTLAVRRLRRPDPADAMAAATPADPFQGLPS